MTRMKWFRSASSLFATLVLATASVAAAQDVDDAGETAMLEAINARRAAVGASALVRDPRLDAAARSHSVEMGQRDVLEHVSETSGTPADRAAQVGIESEDIAENVAMHTDAGSAQSSLEDSEAHLANMLNVAYTHVGIGAIRTPQGVWVTQLFARVDIPAQQAPQQPQAARLPPLQPLPPPMVQQPRIVQRPRVVSPPPPSARAVPMQPGTTPGAIVATIPPSSRTTVVVPGARPGHQPTGYWVCSEGRWWYYPLPAGAAPGTQLQPDLSVHGSPAGYPPGACAAGTRVIAPPPQFAPAPPPRIAPPPVIVRPRAMTRRERRRLRRWRRHGYTIVQPRPGAVVRPYERSFRAGASFSIGSGGPRFRAHAAVR